MTILHLLKYPIPNWTVSDIRRVPRLAHNFPAELEKQFLQAIQDYWEEYLDSWPDKKIENRLLEAYRKTYIEVVGNYQGPL